MNIEIKRCTDAVRPGQAGVSPFVLTALRALRLDFDCGQGVGKVSSFRVVGVVAA
jgi:hypothetical protein